MITELRASAREIVRELGLLDKTGRYPVTLTQRHVLLELGKRGAMNGQALAKYLNLDKSSTSRTIKMLQEKGLLDVTSCPEDKRQQLLSLNKKGALALQVINNIADEQVAAALQHCEHEERRAIQKGLASFAKALKFARISQDFDLRLIGKSDNDAMKTLIKEVLRENGGDKSGTAFSDPELNSLYESYQNKARYFVVSCKSDGKLVGGGGFAPLRGDQSNKVCELQKLYLSSEVQGIGLAELITDRCLATSKAMGYEVCYLETLSTMTRAIEFYKKMGFVELAHRLGESGHFSCDVFMFLPLKPDSNAAPVRVF